MTATDNLCKILTEHGAQLGLEWGWQNDAQQERHKWVIYVLLPTGQVSFHTESHQRI